MNPENEITQKTNIKKDNSLLLMEKKLQSNSTNDIIGNKFLMKPNITKPVKSSFLSKERLDFLEKFKQSTQELLESNNKNKMNIEEEEEINDTNKNKKQIELDLKLGVLDILPESASTTTTTNTAPNHCFEEGLGLNSDTECNYNFIPNEIKISRISNNTNNKESYIKFKDDEDDLSQDKVLQFLKQGVDITKTDIQNFQKNLNKK